MDVGVGPPEGSADMFNCCDAVDPISSSSSSSGKQIGKPLQVILV